MRTNKSSEQLNPCQEHHKPNAIEKHIIRQRLKTPRQIIMSLNITKHFPLQVLELGCGYYASNLKSLSWQFPNVAFTGLDLSVTTDNIPQNVNLFSSDITKLEPFNKYGCVLSLAVIEHLVDPLQHFNLIYELLSLLSVAVLTTPTPKAYLFIDCLSRFGILDKIPCQDHKLYLTRNGIKELAKTAGLIPRISTISYGLVHQVLLYKS